MSGKMSAVHSLADLQRLQQEMLHTNTALLPEPPQPPATLTGTGLKLGFRVQWSAVLGVSGYRVAMMSTNNLNSPIAVSPLLWGDELQTYEWFYGDTTLARQFTVQSFKQSVTGEILYSEFVRPFVSLTSKADGGTADAAATTVATTTQPSEEGTSGDPGGVSPSSPSKLSTL